MLKRQRPVSPPPSFPDVPLLPSEPVSCDLSRHTVKRRRVLPPSLDGPSRGWGSPFIFNQNDDDGEDDEDDDMGAAIQNVDGAPTDMATIQTPSSVAEYKSVNSLLHDLHAEHQYRRVSSSTATAFAPDDYTRSHPFHQMPMSTLEKQFPIQDSQLPRTGIYSEPTTKIAPYFGQELLHAGDVFLGEGLLVKKHYEDTNKYVGHASSLAFSDFMMCPLA